ncbi:hypothetical protein [Brucella sp.]|uniref:hypothetical protein n=1 Tax=Brucella sp. TaxID=52132 RepID=UPI00289A5B28|nr:hypothetical protein [Brucella sp.]
MRQPLSSHMPRAHCNGNKLVLPERLSIATDCGPAIFLPILNAEVTAENSDAIDGKGAST